jgi:ribosomal protein S18 acetylase RimI-like enzyme
MSPAIRHAGPEDANALSRIASRTFTETFGHMYPDEDLQDFLRANYAVAEWTRLLRDNTSAVWLLEDDGEALGYAHAGPCGLPHPDANAEDGELKRLYVLSRARNGGWGGKLFENALEWLQSDGPRTIWISVWSQNFGAQRFYERWGFSNAGEYEFPVGRMRDHEFMFRRDALHDASRPA